MTDPRVPRRGFPLWILAPVLLGAALSIVLVVHAHRVNHGIDGFPLDDPWIHLTYARNLHDHHSFSYFPGERSTAGSTSPLYTLLLAAGFFVTRNEKILSYALGILFHAAFLAFAALWGRKQLGSSIFGLAFALFLALDFRIAILSVSGMETSLYLFLIALSFWAWTERRWRILGVSLGLGMWVRPETLILAGVFLIAMLLERIPGRGRQKGATTSPRGTTVPRGSPAAASSIPPLRTWLFPFFALVLLYMGFNFATGGHLMPNTFAAKHAYYTTPISRFLATGVRESFLQCGFWALTPLAILVLLAEAARLARGRPLLYPAEVGWGIALPLAYILYVPTAHRFSRYLVPALPAVALLGFAALGEVARWGLKARRAGTFSWKSARGGIALALLLIVVGAQAAGAPEADRQYHGYCLYHYQRHERTGRWLEEHTPPTAVVATHDVGAIAYYSNRKVLDIVGLIQPDAVPHLHKPDYPDFLSRWFDREHVTHLAFLENWMEVANEKPLWVADSIPEILSVYPWIPGTTLLVPERASALNRMAVEAGQAGQLPRAIDLLGRSIEISQRNSKTWYLMGVAYTMYGDLGRAEAAFRNALEIFPGYEDAQAGLGYVLQNRQPAAAIPPGPQKRSP